MHGFPVRTPICHIAPISRIYGGGGRRVGERLAKGWRGVGQVLGRGMERGWGRVGEGLAFYVSKAPFEKTKPVS